MSETKSLLSSDVDGTQPEKQTGYTINLNVNDSDQMENKPADVHRCSKWVQYLIFTIFIVLISTGCLLVYRSDNGATNKKVTNSTPRKSITTATIPNYEHTSTTVVVQVENTDERPPNDTEIKKNPRFIQKLKEKIEKIRTNIGERPPIKPKLQNLPRLVKKLKEKVVTNQKNMVAKLPSRN